MNSIDERLNLAKASLDGMMIWHLNKLIFDEGKLRDSLLGTKSKNAQIPCALRDDKNRFITVK